MVSLAAQRCRHWDRVPEDSSVETEEWGTEDRLGDFLEEGRQTNKRKLDGSVAEGWHNCLVQSCQELGGMVFRDVPLLQSLLVYRGVPTHSQGVRSQSSRLLTKVSLPPFASSMGSMPGF